MMKSLFARLGLAIAVSLSAAAACATSPDDVIAGRFQRHVFHILFDNEAAAVESRDAIADRAGDDPASALVWFRVTAKAQSKDLGSANQGGDLGFAKWDRFVPDFRDAMFLAPVGMVVGPVKTQFGWHLILVTEDRWIKSSQELSLDAGNALRARLIPRLGTSWVYFFQGSNGDVAFRHTDTRSRGPNVRSAWILVAKGSQQHLPTGQAFSSSRSILWADCHDRTMAETDVAYYAGEEGGGELVATLPIRFKPELLAEIIPDSLGDAFSRAVCDPKPLPAKRRPLKTSGV